MVFCIHLASLGKTKNTKSWKEKAQICTFAWTCLITVLHLHSLASGHSLITLKLFLFFRWKCLSPYEEAFLPLSPVFWFCLPLPLLNNNMLNPASSPAWCRCGVFFFFFFHKKRIFLQARAVYLPLLVWNWKVTLGSQSLWSWANFRWSTFYPDLQDAQRGIGHSSEQSEKQLKTSYFTYVSSQGRRHISDATCAQSVGGRAVWPSSERGFIWCHTNTHSQLSISLLVREALRRLDHLAHRHKQTER